LYCNLLRNRFHVTLICTVAVGRSDCEHFRHIRVRPAYKRKQQTFFTQPYLYIYGYFSV